VASISRAKEVRPPEGRGTGPENVAGERCSQRSQKEFLEVPLRDSTGANSGKLVADFLLTDLLCGTDLNWLNDRYQVEFLTDLGEVIFTTKTSSRPALGATLTQELGAFEATSMELTSIAPEVVWFQNIRTVALLGGLLTLGLIASLWLRYEMGRVDRAVATAQTEAAWRQSMEDSALVGLRARDPQGRLLYVNRTLCEMVGYTHTELVGLKPPMPFWPPEAIDGMMARNLRTLAGGSPATGFESRWQHKDGHMLDVMIFESRLLDSNGKHIGWMGSIVDIGERKRLEEKDRDHAQVMAQHARLNDMGLMASELAHELNQPLTAIVSYSAGLAIAIQKLAPADQDLVKAAEETYKSARKAGEIVNWIRSQTNRAAPQRQPCDMHSIISAAVALRKAHLAVSQVQLTVQTEAEPCMVMADRVGLEQVVSNLVRNATDSLLELDSERCIGISVERLGTGTEWSTVRVIVRDNGPGLQGRTLDMLCATFYSTKHEGLGLGLGICRAIVEAHGGELHASEAPGGGAQFTFSIPHALQSNQMESI
jgi:two-component system sensor histidine kinase DctS